MHLRKNISSVNQIYSKLSSRSYTRVPQTHSKAYSKTCLHRKLAKCSWENTGRIT